MEHNFYHDFGAALLYALLSLGFVAGALIFGWLIRPARPYPDKTSTYECGEDTIGTSFVQFNVRYYVIALIFLIFDVEVAALIPWATIYEQFGVLALVEMGVFIAILVVGFAYVWVKKDLDWVRSLGARPPEGGEEAS
jgi:NADH-quinone oxidoreductase subunit A